MKKILSLFACAMLVLFSGVLLCACGSSTHMISISFNEPELAYATVEIDGQQATANLNGKFEARGDSKVRVKFFAHQYGTDINSIQVKVNNKTRNLETFNTHFDSFHNGGDLYFGYLAFGNLTEDANITVSGLKGAENKLTFVEAENQDDAAKQRMQNAYIKLPNQTDFTNFAVFLAGDATLTYNLLGGNNFERTFQMKFDGGNPFEVSMGTPFQIVEGEQKDPLSSFSYSAGTFEEGEYNNGIYTFDLGDLGAKTDLKIEADFSKLKCRDFNVNLGSNQMYEVKLGTEKSTLNFETETTISVKKLSEDINFDEENLKAFLNDQPLEKVEPQEEPAEDGTITFAVPKGLTPESTGGQDEFNFRLEGVNFTQTTHKLSAQTNEAHPVHLIAPQFDSVDDVTGEKQGVVGYDQDGNVVTFEDKTNVLIWQYDAVQYGEKFYYTTPYDLYDYDVLLDTETLLNVKAILTNAEHEADFQAGNEITHSLDGDITFKATFNQNTQKYDTFELKFKATKDMAFTFDNFKTFTKQVTISYDFEDSRIEQITEPVTDGSETDDKVKVVGQVVDFAIGQAESTELDWTSLGKRNETTQPQNVKFGDVIFFRLHTLQVVGENEYRLKDTIASNSWLNGETVMENGVSYLILKFNISDIYFDTVENLKLVPAYAA